MSTHARIIIAGIAVSVVSTGATISMILGPDVYSAIRAKHVRQQLLCETDHQALLDACRELSTRVADGSLEANIYRVRSWQHPEVSRFPEPIRALRPWSVTLTQRGMVRVEINAKWWSLGVNAYPEGEEKRSPKSGFGDRKLLDGLWYYDDQYRHDPDYDERIDALLKAHEGTQHMQGVSQDQKAAKYSGRPSSLS